MKSSVLIFSTSPNSGSRSRAAATVLLDCLHERGIPTEFVDVCNLPPVWVTGMAWPLHFPWLRNWLMRMSEKSNPGIWGGLLCRKRYIDDKLVAACTRIDAIVTSILARDSIHEPIGSRPLRICLCGRLTNRRI